MTNDEQRMLDDFKGLQWTEGWDREEYFTAGWHAAIAYYQEKVNQSRLLTSATGNKIHMCDEFPDAQRGDNDQRNNQVPISGVSES